MSDSTNTDPMSRDNVMLKLQGMKLTYARERVYANPVLLLSHFQEFEAYTTILETHYGKLREQEENKTAEVKQEEWESKKKFDAVVRERKEANSKAKDKEMTQGEVDKNVEYRMRSIKANMKLLETETKSCRSHVNAMQSILKAYGDEAKSVK